MKPSKFLVGALLGLLLHSVSGRSVPQDVYEINVETVATDDAGATTKPIMMDSCPQALAGLATIKESSIFDEVSFLVHRNGEPDACGVAPSSTAALERAIQTLQDCEGQELDKYQVEALVTTALAELLEAGSCGSEDDEEAAPGILGFCDMGEDRTPVLTDHEMLVRVQPAESLPCRFFTREGVRISTLTQLQELAEKSKTAVQQCPPDQETCAAASGLHLYAVPAGRMFMFAPQFVGETFDLPHATGREGQPISIRVLSLEPRVFDIFNFFSPVEAKELIDKALGETSETHKLHRSTTGLNGQFFKKRTSDNAWDTHGKTALVIKKYVWLLRLFLLSDSF